MLKQPTFDLTKRDAQSVKHDFLKTGGYLDTHFGARAVNFRENGAAMALVELECILSGELFSFYINKEAREQSLLTAREPDNVIQRAQEFGYSPRLPVAATGVVRFTTTYAGLVVFAKGHKFKTSPNYTDIVYFEADADTIKAAGALTVDIPVTEGETVVDPDRTSTGTVGVKVLLDQYPVIQDSIVVLVSGVTWTRVDNFLSSYPADTHYRVLAREVFPGQRRYYIEFGDGVNGLYPPVGSLVQTSYRKGGGVRGNVPEGNITVSETAILNPFGTSVSGTLTNPDDCAGGIDADTTDAIRVNGMAAIVTNSRLVSNEDYELAARALGVARCKAVTKDDYSLVDENTILLYCSNELGVAMSTVAREAVRLSLINNYPNNGTVRLVVGAAQYDSFVVTVRARLAQGTSFATLAAMIYRITEAFLDYSATIANPDPRYVIDCGVAVHPSNLEAIIESLEGVVSSRVLFDGEHDDFVPDVYKIPWASSITYDIAFES